MKQFFGEVELSYYKKNQTRIRKVQKKYRKFKRRSHGYLKKLKKQNHDYYVNSGYYDENYDKIRSGQKEYRKLKSTIKNLEEKIKKVLECNNGKS